MKENVPKTCADETFEMVGLVADVEIEPEGSCQVKRPFKCRDG